MSSRWGIIRGSLFCYKAGSGIHVAVSKPVLFVGECKAVEWASEEHCCTTRDKMPSCFLPVSAECVSFLQQIKINKLIIPFIKCKYKSCHCNALSWSGDIGSFSGALQPGSLHQLHQGVQGQAWGLLSEPLGIGSAAGFAAWVLVGGLGAVHSTLRSLWEHFTALIKHYNKEHQLLARCSNSIGGFSYLRLALPYKNATCLFVLCSVWKVWQALVENEI